MNNRRTRRRYRIKNKLRFTASMIIMVSLITAIVLFVGTFDFVEAADSEAADSIKIEIVSGDTLWDIANQYKSSDTDVRKAIFEISKYNNVSSSELSPGMIIEIPDNI